METPGKAIVNALGQQLLLARTWRHYLGFFLHGGVLVTDTGSSACLSLTWTPNYSLDSATVQTWPLS